MDNDVLYFSSANRVPLQGVAAVDTQRLAAWNETHRQLPFETTLHRMVEEQVDRTPGAIALEFGGKILSYRELDRRANQLAHRLRALGVRPESLVGVCMTRSLELLVGLLGILKAGAAYVPLDPDYPANLLTFMVADSGARVVLVHGTTEPGFRAKGAVTLSVDGDATLADEPDTRPDVAVSPEGLAYVIYTSGSTGTPKGAMNEHRGICNRLLWMQAAYELGPDERVLQKTPTSFDVSVWELFWPLIVGSRLVLAKPGGHRDNGYLVDLIERAGITTLHFVPSMLALFLEEPELSRCKSLRRVICSGEALPVELAERALSRLDAELHNLYGPTECAVDVTAWHCERGRERLSTVPIGWPIANLRIYLLDSDRRPVADGETGEIYIAGVGVGRGYLNRAELTAERFLPDPLGQTPRDKMYRTGDLGRRRSDGSVEYLGRIDNQCKIRGFRIELGAIESVLLQHRGIREAVVVAEDAGAPTQKRLVAYLVTDRSETPSLRSLRTHLLEALPEYMTPSVFVRLEAMPLLPSGKADRKALRLTLGDVITPEQSSAVAQSAIEEKLADIWQAILGLERVGVEDDFLELGGDSLLALRLVARARAEGLVFSVPDVFAARTIASLANTLSSEQAMTTKPVTATTKASLPDLSALLTSADAEDAYPLSALQQGVLYHSLDLSQPGIYCEQLVLEHGPGFDELAFAEAFQQVVDRHPALRCTFMWEGLSEPAQVVQRRAPIPVAQWDLGELPATDARARLETLLRQDRALGFDLARAPLMRLAFVRLPEGETAIVWSYHHVIIDGWTASIVLDEVFSIFSSRLRGETPTLAPPRSHREYIEWLAQQDLAPVDRFFRQELAGFTEPTPLGVDRVETKLKAAEPRSIRRALSLDVTKRLRSMARQYGLTMNTLMQGAWAVVLSKYSGHDNVVFGMTTAGRPLELDGMDRIVGVLINTLPLRVRIPAEGSVSSWLADLQARAFAMRRFDHASLVRVHELTGVPREQPLFESILVYQNRPLDTWIAEQGSGLRPASMDLPERTNFPLVLEAIPRSDHLVLRASYAPARFTDETIQRLLGHLEMALLAFAADPTSTPASTQFLTDVERALLLTQWNDTRHDYAKDVCVHELVQAQAQRTPDALALSFGNTSLTYRDLVARSGKLARRLAALGAGPSARVGIALDRSVDLVIALLAVLETGAAYVPLDPTYPADRVAFMARDSGLMALVTEERLRDRFGELGVPLVLPHAHDEPTSASALPRIGPENLAYVLYTSGSTGQPKGVMVSHRNLVAFFAAMDERVGAKSGVFLAVTSISFDISGLELLWTLTRGFHVVVAKDQATLVASASSARLIDFSLFFFPRDSEQVRGPDKFKLLLEGARFADSHDFAAVWVPERHFHSFGGVYPNPSVAAAAVATVTKRVGIRAGSVVLPLHDTVRVAEEWSMVDNLSGGRVGISLAPGWHAGDFVFAPDRFESRKEALRQGLADLRGLWSGAALTRRAGAGRDVEVRLWPRPVQNELPLWLTSAGSAQTFEDAGRAGMRVLTHLLGQSFEEIGAKIALYRRAYREAGHAGNGHVTLMIHTYLDADPASARQLARPAMRAYLQSAANLLSLSRTGDEITDADKETLLDQAVERYLEAGGLFGTPESCLPLVQKIQQLGIDELACLIDFGIDTAHVLAGLEHLDSLRKLATQVPEDSSLSALVARHGVTHMQCTPSLLRAILDTPDAAAALQPLEKLLVGGEAFPPNLAQRAVAAVSGDVLNMYGPTETTIWSTTHKVTRDDSTSVSIGMPIANTRVYVLDSRERLAPLGVLGTLWIGGDGVVPGYLGRPDLTQTRFIRDPFDADPEARMYCTGDLVRWRENGTLEFLGRVDHQVKLRGHRIELGEIEAALERLAAVRTAVVVAQRSAEGEAQLVAYVVPNDPERPPTAAELSAALAVELPAIMVPSGFLLLPTLPLTPNGKVDRKALPALQSSVSVDRAGQGPATPLEHRVGKIWSEILGVGAIGRDDSFYSLGGNSLLALRFVSRAKAEGISVMLAQFLAHPTLAGVASHIEKQGHA